MPFSPKQIESFNDADARINFWFGAVRSGKTFASIFKLIDEIKNGPQGNVMIVGVNRDSIQRNVLVELYNLLGFPCPSSKSTEAMLYGRHIYFVGAHDESSVKRIQGSTLAIAYVDEAPCIPAPFWKMLLSRLSVKGAKLLATGNPEGPYHWLKREFLDRKDELDLKAWHFNLDDNPVLDAKYKESLKKEYSGMWYKRFILGEWAVAEGLIYSNFDEVNIYDQPSNNAQFYAVGIDYGTTNATAAVLAAINTRVWPQIRIESEYYWDSRVRGRSKTDSELAEDLKDFIKGKDVRAVYVDPAAASLKLELRRMDMPVYDAVNDVLLGIKITDKFISNKNLVVHKSCSTLIQQIHTYSWCAKAADRGEDKPEKVNDHICDATRYLCASAFPQGEIHNPNNDLSLEEVRRQIYGDEMMTLNPGIGGYF